MGQLMKQLESLQEVKNDLSSLLGVQPNQPLVPTWKDHVYSCTYHYKGGALTLAVKELADKASTGIKSSLRTNEIIKQATLTVRKAGENPLEYLKITLKQARIVAYSTSAESADSGPEVREEVSFAFQQLTVEYTPQGADGLARGSSMFETEV
jgi:type VI protein secretion system component Hcp